MNICRYIKMLAAALACALLLSACSKDREDRGMEERGDAFRVAVVLPMSGGLQENWQRTLKLL